MDHKIALKTLERCATQRQACSDDGWRVAFEQFREHCRDAGHKTMVAVLGTAILAKATDVNVSAFSLRVSDNTLESYSARSLAKSVLAKNAIRLKYSIGSSSPEPLNNQPWFHSIRISSDINMHKKFASLFSELLRLLEKLDGIKNQQILEMILCSYLNTGLEDLNTVVKMSENLGSHSSADLLRAIEFFVSENSEHGKRAQAVAAGLADWFFGRPHVSTNKVNDPSRSLPGDVLITRKDTRANVIWEVKDRPVTDSDLSTFLNRLSNNKPFTIRKACMIAVDSTQEPLNVRQVISDSKITSIQMRAFCSWRSLLHELIFWSECDPDDTEDAYEFILQRTREIEASEKAVNIWSNIRAILAI